MLDALRSCLNMYCSVARPQFRLYPTGVYYKLDGLAVSHTIRNKKKLQARVRRIRGQVESVDRALENETECGEVLRLIAAARGAMNSLMAEVVEDLRGRFGLERVVFVGDRGMVTLKNLEQLRQAEQGYLVGLQRRNRQDIPYYIQQAVAREQWQECPVGITGSEKARAPKTRVQEVAGREPGVRVFVVYSEEREQYERSLRELQFTGAEKDYLAKRIQVLKANWFKEKEKQLGNLNVTFQQVSERLNRLTDAYLDGTVDKELYEDRKAALLFEKRAIEDRLSDLKTGKTSIPEEVQKFLELAGDAYSLYKTPITGKKRRLLKTVTSNCSVDEENLDFAFAIPFREVAKREKSIDGRASKVVHRTLDALLKQLLAHFKKEPFPEFEPIND